MNNDPPAYSQIKAERAFDPETSEAPAWEPPSWTAARTTRHRENVVLGVEAATEDDLFWLWDQLNIAKATVVQLARLVLRVQDNSDRYPPLTREERRFLVNLQPPEDIKVRPPVTGWRG